MHRLLIVDDDEILRTGIEKNIDWRANGIEVAGTAANGRECIEMIQKCLPQIVLTDIKMPFMDGLQLSEILYHLYPNIQIVLLTAYNDFEFVKKALSYKVSDYIMKYEDNSVILNAVKKAGDDYDRQKSKREIVRESSKLLTNHFFQKLVENTLEPGQIEEQASRLNVHFTEPGFQLLCLEIASGGNSAGALIWENSELCEQCGSLIVDCVKAEHRRGYAFVEKEKLVCMLNSEVPMPSEDLAAVLSEIEAVLNLVITAGVGNYYQEFSEIHRSYEEAVQALGSINDLTAKGQKILYFSDKAHFGNSQAAVLQMVKKYIEKNYGNEGLSLNLIAQEVHLTPNYISTLFKRHCQINIIDYVTEIRIAKAKELLTKTDLKIYQIAESIGYTNSQYFSILFKKSTGMSPVEYRQCDQVKSRIV